MQIKVGDVLALKNMRVVIQDGKGWMDFRSPGKDECYVVMLLGTEGVKADGKKLDPMAVLNALGWVPASPEEAKP